MVEEKRKKATEKKELFHFDVMFAFKTFDTKHSFTQHTQNSSHSSWSYQSRAREKKRYFKQKEYVYTETHTHSHTSQTDWRNKKQQQQYNGDHVHTVEKSSVSGRHTVVFCFIFDYGGDNENDFVVVVHDNKNAAKQTHTVYFNLSRWQTKKERRNFFPFSNMIMIYICVFFVAVWVMCVFVCVCLIFVEQTCVFVELTTSIRIYHNKYSVFGVHIFMSSYKFVGFKQLDTVQNAMMSEKRFQERRWLLAAFSSHHF